MTTTRTTVTQADRIAAVASVYGAKVEYVPEPALNWAATGDNGPLLLADAIGHDKCLRRVVEFVDHRERSTQALREAAERVLRLIECDGIGSHEWCFSLVALRSALAAETKGTP